MNIMYNQRSIVCANENYTWQVTEGVEVMVLLRGVNLYVFHVSLTDFHCFDWLTHVRGNPYGFIKKNKKQNLF